MITMRSVSSSDLLPSRQSIFYLAIFLSNISSIIGYLIVRYIARPRFMAFYLILLSSLLIFDFLFLTYSFVPGLFSQSLLVQNKSIEWIFDFKVGLIFIFIAISVYLLAGPGITFYLLLTAIIVIGTILLSMSPSPEQRIAGLGLLLIASSMLILSESMKGTFYTGSGDSVFHTTIIQSISSNGSVVENIVPPRMRLYLGFHRYASMGTILLNIDARTATALLMAGAFQLTTLSVYLFTKRIDQAVTAAITAGLFATLPTVIYAGSLAHYRSLSFVYFTFFIFLMTESNHRRRFFIPVLLVIPAWIITHHVSIVLASVFLGSLVFSEIISRQRNIVIPSISIFALVFIYYYANITGSLREIFVWIFITSPGASGVTATAYTITYITDLTTLITMAIPVYLSYFYYVPLLGFGGFGFYLLLVRCVNPLGYQPNWKYLIPTAFPAFAIYVPNPLWIPLESVAEISRWQLIAAPFFVMIVAIGIQSLLKIERPQWAPSLLQVSLLVIVVVSLVISAPMNGGLVDMVGNEHQPQRYFTNQEIAALDHVVDYPTDEDLSAYSDAGTYISLRMPSQSETQTISRIEVQDEETAIRPADGLTVFSQSAYENNGVKLNRCHSVNNDQICHTIIATPTDFHLEFHQSGKIYANGDTEIRFSSKATT